MLWQYRYPHGETHWEVPAGRIHRGESPRDAARRELLEESGCRARELEELPGFYPINGISDHFAHAFVARGCTVEAAPDPDPAEQLVVRLFEPDAVRAMLLRGTIRDGFTALALHAWLLRG